VIVGAAALALTAGTACTASGAKLPDGFLIRPGQDVLLFGDSIIAPGMYGYVCNSLLDRLYPDSGVTFHCYGRAGATAESILPFVPKALEGKQYDWVLINFGHNDAGRFTADEFKESCGTLIEEIRKFSDARLGWMGVVGSEPTAFADEPGQEKRAERLRQSRAKHAALAQASKEFCQERNIAYVPLHEEVDRLLHEREEQGLKVMFTMDASHPNLVGNWLIGAALLQALGLRPEPMTIEVLQGEATSDHGRLPVPTLEEPLELRFKGLFLRVRLVPPAHRRTVCPRVEKTVVLDGRLGDWEGIPEHTIAAPDYVTWELVPRCAASYAASMRTCWDGENLYLAFRIREPELGEGTFFPEIIEVFIDARKHTSRSGNVWRRTKGLTQYCFHRDFRDAEKGPTVKVMVNGDREQGEGVRAAVARTDEGYALEAAIPLGSLRQIEAGPGTILPWNWAVSFTDQSVNLDWLGLMSRSQSTRGYGELILGPVPNRQEQ